MGTTDDVGRDRFDELRLSGQVMGKLADDPKAFAEAVEAFRAQDAQRFQGVLERLGLLDHCRVVCSYLCSKHCVFVCHKLAGRQEGRAELDVDEWRRFAQLTQRLTEDESLLRRLVEVVDREDEKTFQAVLTELQAVSFAHQLCHWLCGVRCRLVCRVLCPPPPLVTAVGLIPSGQIASTGLAAGPSFPPGPTPADVKSPGGVGDHPYGGTANIKGVFNTTGAVEYKVDVTPVAGGAPFAVTTAVTDYRFNPAWPGPGEPLYVYYTRATTADWYSIAAMGLLGTDYLTDWDTRTVADGEYDVRVVVRTGSGAERVSPPVRVVVDNTRPNGPGPGGTPVMTIRQGDRELDCCETVTRDGGPIVVHVEGEDLHYSSLSVTLYGGCSVSSGIYSATYDGDLAERGAPAPGIDIPWDPWAEGVDPCCYVIFFRIRDRAVTSNSWSGGNVVAETWRSITIG
ncbi:hypothetical protein [Aquipuribacter sp. MA13-6]|uniref:hypothetical protein n=1 Tax=unclassified Aquipuribacter TaxID=2635084 RepID=UPI003EED3288